MSNKIFVRLDVDDIGNSIELSLLKGDFVTAQQIHNDIQKNINLIFKKLQAESSVIILMKGCDDILFSIEKCDYDLNFLKELKDTFKLDSNFTLSIGVGKSINESMLNLRIAKISGKDKIVENNS